MPLVGQLVDQRFVQSGPLVLRPAPLKYRTPTADRDQPVSRRSEPSSRIFLIGEQPNPWDLIIVRLYYYKYQTIPSSCS